MQARRINQTAPEQSPEYNATSSNAGLRHQRMLDLVAQGAGGVIGIPEARAGGIIGIPEAPVDGSMYGREDALWDFSVPLAGGTMTGRLILAGPPPNDPQAAVTKEYVDTQQNLDGGTY
jgi:hypothetical protein